MGLDFMSPALAESLANRKYLINMWWIKEQNDLLPPAGCIFPWGQASVLLTFHSNNTDSQNACVSMAGCEEVMPFPYEPPDQKEL